MKIGIFGGMFDPIHNGHVRVAISAKDELGLDKMIILPIGIGGHRNPATIPKQIRLGMVEKVFGDMHGFEVSDWSVKRTAATYMIDYLKHLRKTFKDDSLFLILGADELVAFPHWKDPDGIIKRARIVGYPRTKESSTKIRDRIGGANFNPGEIPGKVLKTAVIFLR